jgi:hypothetical protein
MINQVGRSSRIRTCDVARAVLRVAMSQCRVVSRRLLVDYRLMVTA